MSEFLTTQKLRYYQQLFASLDYNNTGTLLPQQLHTILRSMHIRLSFEDAIELIRQTGNEKENCEVSLSEFLAIISMQLFSYNKSVIEDKDFNEEIYEVFKVFDVNKNKVIDIKDFQMGFEKMQVEISKDQLLKMLQATGRSEFTLKDFRQFILDK